MSPIVLLKYQSLRMEHKSKKRGTFIDMILETTSSFHKSKISNTPLPTHL